MTIDARSSTARSQTAPPTPPQTLSATPAVEAKLVTPPSRRTELAQLNMHGEPMPTDPPAVQEALAHAPRQKSDSKCVQVANESFLDPQRLVLADPESKARDPNAEDTRT